jgi:hypothetical protein
MRFLDKHTDRDKLLLRLERELHRLWQARAQAPIIPLEHPYRRGWFKTFVLREDACHHPETPVFRIVLEVINSRVYSHNRDFVQRSGDPIALRPLIIETKKWAKLPWTFRHQRLFGFGQWPVEDNFPWSQRYRRNWIRGFKLIRDWWLEETVLPHMITHQRVELPEVRRRVAEIEAYLNARLGWQRLSRLHGRRAHWHGGPDSAPVLRANAALLDQCA